MAKKLSDKLKSKKGKLPNGLNKSRAINISKNLISVYLLSSEEEIEKNKDKKIKLILNKKDQKLAKIIQRINAFRLKNKRIDLQITKLRNRKFRGVKLKDNPSNVKKLKRIGFSRTSNSFIDRIRQNNARKSLRKLRK